MIKVNIEQHVQFKSLILRGEGCETLLDDLDDWWYILGTSFRNLPNEGGINFVELILVNG